MSGGFGPGFQDARSKLYRAEYGIISAAIFGFLLWRTFYGSGGIDWVQVLFWAVFPDLASFIPIGISSRRRQWPSWGSTVYNTFHTVLVWSLVFVVILALFHVTYFPLVGWLGHISVDRSVGYTLRSNSPSNS